MVEKDAEMADLRRYSMYSHKVHQMGVFHKNPRYAEDTEFSKIRRKELVRWNHDYHYKVWRWVSEMLSEKIFMELGSLGAMGMIGS